MKIYTLLIIDRHCDPQVMVFRESEDAENEAAMRANKYWKLSEVNFNRGITGLLRITCEDVGSMEVQEHEISLDMLRCAECNEGIKTLTQAIGDLEKEVKA